MAVSVQLVSVAVLFVSLTSVSFPCYHVLEVCSQIIARAAASVITIIRHTVMTLFLHRMHGSFYSLPPSLLSTAADVIM